VAIARAVASDPAILVADEPTGDLDKASADEVLEYNRLNRELSKTMRWSPMIRNAAERPRSRHLEKGSWRRG
jgi:putative ABC transport system ATP-binding protein